MVIVMENEFVFVVTTAGSEEEADNIAEKLVKEDLAACVQVSGPVKSTYEWKGELHNDEEWFCFIKSSNELFEELEETIKDIHSYENPEIIALPIEKGSEDYLNWLRDNLRK